MLSFGQKLNKSSNDSLPSLLNPAASQLLNHGSPSLLKCTTEMLISVPDA